MGAVFEVEDTTLHRRVALKVIQPAEAYLNSDAADRLMEEARILAQLEHPGIVPVHDAGVLPDGNIYYTMKLVEGRRLDNLGSLPDVLRLFQKICDAVAFAHAHGIVHRDLKPENIMVGAFGEVLVMDWGVAKILGKAREATGTIIGTPEFMSPEQARGDVDGIDARTDVFALGAILEFLLTNKAVPRSLRAVCGKAKANSPETRYASAIEVAKEVGRYLDGEPVDAYRENLFERSRRVVLNNPMAFALVAAYLVMRILVFLLLKL